MNNYFKRNYKTFIFLIGLGFGFYFLVQMHEEVHVTINNWYGIESTVEYNWFSFNKDVPLAQTKSEGGGCIDNCVLLHGMNEIIGYPLMMIYLLVGFGFAILIYFVDNKELKVEVIQEGIKIIDDEKD